MATLGPGPNFAARESDHILVRIWDRDFLLNFEIAERLANDIYDALHLEHVTRPLDMARQAKDNFRDFFDDKSLFNEKAINDALSSTIDQNDRLTNAALILANNVAAVMKMHGFSFDEAMKIVSAAKEINAPN
jgi:hypothetical protein